MSETALKKTAAAASPARTRSPLAAYSAAARTAAAPPSKLSKGEEEEEDGDEEDEDDDDEEDDDAAKRQGSKGGQDTSKWSSDEQTAVLDFYGMDTLFPRIWVDLRERAATAAASGASGTSSTPSAASVRASKLGVDMLKPEPASAGVQGASNTKNITYMVIDGRTVALDTSDPLGIRESILRRNKRRESIKPVFIDNPTIFISEKTFNPTMFLRDVHRSTSYRDLEQGVVRLKASIEQRNEIVKNMVKKHFAKFVNAKATIDLFYKEMRQKNLVSSPDYGISPFARALDALEQNANKLYGPILGRRSDGDKIRIALSILEGWKFFFNLPSSLNDQIKKLKYDVAVRDYKKGKSLMISSFGEDAVNAGNNGGTASGSGTNSNRTDNRREKDPTLSLLPKTHRAVFEKVWIEVERIIGRLRDELFTKLGDPSHSLDTQEKIIGYLVDLDVEKSPVWCFLESQYLWFVDRIKSCYRTYAQKMIAVSQELSSSSQLADKNASTLRGSTPALNASSKLATDPLPAASAQQERISLSARPAQFSAYEIQKGLACITSRNFELFFRNNDDVQAWRLTLRFVQELCSIICDRLPDLSKICRTFVEGRLHRIKGSDGIRKTELNRRAQRVNQILRNIFVLVATVFADAFGLHMSYTEISGMYGDSRSRSKTQQNAASAMAQTDRSMTSAFMAVPLGNTHIAMYSDQNFAPQDASLGLMTADNREEGSSTPAHEIMDDQTFSELLVVPDLSDIRLDAYRHYFLISHPLIVSHYAVKTISVLEQAYEDIRAISFFSQDENLMQPLSITFTHIQSRLTECICESLVTTSAVFYQYEDWTHETSVASATKAAIPSANDSCTATTKLFYRLHRFMLVAVGHLYATMFFSPTMLADSPSSSVPNLNAASASTTGLSPSSVVLPSVVTSVQRAHAPQRQLLSSLRQYTQDKIRQAMFESHYLFLDGLQWLVTCYRSEKRQTYIYGKDRDTTIHNQWVEAGVLDSGLSSVLPFNAPPQSTDSEKPVTEQTIETRCFIALGNISFLRMVAIPKLTEILETRLNTHATADIKNLTDTVDYLDNILVQNYVRRQTLAIDRMVQSGILFSGLDWMTLGKPQDVRQYCYQVLLHLVLAHAAVAQVSRALLRKVMAEMIVALACSLLSAYRVVDGFNMGGMLQATLETEFLHHTLKAYETPQSAAIMAMVYDTIERSTEKQDIPTSGTLKSATGSGMASTMNDALVRVKGFLDQAKATTAVQFLCFREDEEGGAEQDPDRVQTNVM